MTTDFETTLTNVLIIDDNEVDRERVIRALKGDANHFSVYESGSLMDGVETSQAEPIDVVVLDLRLQTTSGLDTLRSFQSLAPSLPIVLLSGIADERTASKALEMGAEDFVDKSRFENQWFRIVLQNAVQRFDTKRKLIDYSKQLELANSDLENFAYFASHDLQEPLRAINGFSTLLQRELSANGTEKSIRYASQIKAGAVKMSSLIKGMLEYPRISLDEQTFAMVDLNDCVSEASSSLSASLTESNGSIQTGDLPVVYGHHGLLTQLMQNLIGNAIKYRHPGQQPKIRVFTAENATDYLIHVQDNGIGIAKEHQQKIFEIFNRLHRHSEYTGNGIGLAICQRVVELHSGELSVESDPSTGAAGSNFQVRLPKHRPNMQHRN